MDEALEKEQLRNLLSPLVSKVPASINNGDIKLVRDWKELVIKTRKAMDSRKTTKTQLMSLYTQLLQYK